MIYTCFAVATGVRHLTLPMVRYSAAHLSAFCVRVRRRRLRGWPNASPRPKKREEISAAIRALSYLGGNCSRSRIYMRKRSAIPGPQYM